MTTGQINREAMALSLDAASEQLKQAVEQTRRYFASPAGVAEEAAATVIAAFMEASSRNFHSISSLFAAQSVVDQTIAATKEMVAS